MTRSMMNGAMAKKIPGTINVRSLFPRKGQKEEYLRIEKTKPESRKNRGMQNASTTWITPSGALLCNMKTPMMAMPLA